MISVSGVSMRFASKVLFDDVTTTFSSGRRYGLTGPNGAGKSTFMKLLTGDQPLWQALEERDVLYARTEMSNEDGMRLAELEGIVGEEDGYTAESDAAILLQGLDIPNALHEKAMAELQGGQKVRVLLAQALFG